MRCILNIKCLLKWKFREELRASYCSSDPYYLQIICTRCAVLWFLSQAEFLHDRPTFRRRRPIWSLSHIDPFSVRRTTGTCDGRFGVSTSETLYRGNVHTPKDTQSWPYHICQLTYMWLYHKNNFPDSCKASLFRRHLLITVHCHHLSAAHNAVWTGTNNY